MSGVFRVGALAAALVSAVPLSAQQRDSARVGITAPTPDTAAPRPARQSGPPISPANALLRSILVPGWGQAKLRRGTAGALFAVMEVGSVAMLVQSKKELALAQRLARDSLFLTDSTRAPNPFAPVVRRRKSQVEDWAALVVFTHLLAGADAFVAAHLWDVPVRVGGEARARAAVVETSIPW